MRFVTLAILAMIMAKSSMATTICYPREQMLSYIERDYQGTKVGSGIVRPYSIMEIWVSQRNGDWIMVQTDLHDSSCIVAYGEDFKALPVGTQEGAT